MTGYDADGRRLRYKVCQDCATRFTTLEVTVPFSLFQLDPKHKERHRLNMRKYRGYQGGIGGAQLKPEPRLQVTVKVA